MLKKLLILIAIISLSSCKSKVSSDSTNKNTAIKENSMGENGSKENYQTINDENQAELLNQQALAQSQEIEVQDRVFFGLNASDIDEDSKKILNTQAEWLKSDPTIKITIEGDCDERGTREYNIALGEKRANSVKKYLSTNGVLTSRIKTISYGKERPAFFGDKEESLAKNRRAVTVVN